MQTNDCKSQASARAPGERLDLVRAFQRSAVEPGDDELDAALGLPPRKPVLGIYEDPELARRHPHESFADLPTPFDVTRGLFEALDLGPDDVLFDLGCGTGRVVLYGAVVSPARFVGIEIVEERVEVARDAVRASGIERVTFVAASALDHELSTPSVLYLSRPFADEIEAKVVAKIQDEARRRALTVVTHRMRPGRFDPAVLEPISTGTLTIYRSRAFRS